MKKHTNSSYREELRKRAEACLTQDLSAINTTTPAEVQTLIEELHVHQIELEMQNEELRQTQSELEATRDTYIDLYNTAPVGYVTVDEKGIITAMNLTGASLLGRERCLSIGKPLSNFIVKNDRDIFYFHRRTLLEAGAPHSCELRLVKGDGHVFYARLDSRIRTDNDHNRNQMRTIVTDITARKQAEQEVESLAKFPSENPSPVLRVDRNGRLLYANEAAFSGFSNWKLQIGQAVPDLLQALTHEKAGQRINMKDIPHGTRVFSVAASHARDAGYTTMYALDITERKQAEVELRQSEARFKGLFENSPDIVALTDLKGICLDINNVAPGYTKKDVIGSRFTDFLTPEQTTVFHETLKKAVETGTPQGYEADITNPQGRTFSWHNRISPITTEGAITQVVITCTDISARKQAEVELQKYSEHLEEMVAKRTNALQEAHEQLIRREKLAVLGQMSGSVGHELRTPLATISNAVYYLKMVLPDADDRIAEYLGIIASETRNAEKIIADLLDFSRVKSLDRQKIRVEDVVALVLKKQEAPNTVQVTTDIPADLPSILVDPTHIEQVLHNLIANACQAMPDGGTLSVVSTQCSGISDNCSLNTEHCVLITVRDSGCGIPPENLEKLFEPLFTTKPKGIGLGLAVCKNLLEANGGAIEVESEEARGTTFTLRLPCEEGTP